MLIWDVFKVPKVKSLDSDLWRTFELNVKVQIFIIFTNSFYTITRFWLVIYFEKKMKASDLVFIYSLYICRRRRQSFVIVVACLFYFAPYIEHAHSNSLSAHVFRFYMCIGYTVSPSCSALWRKTVSTLFTTHITWCYALAWEFSEGMIMKSLWFIFCVL